MKDRRSGFTLIEMLVVMAIVALLLTIALPRYFGALDTAKDRVLAENLNTLRSTIDKFYSDKGRYPDSLEEMVDKGYLRQVPTDPITESQRTWVLVPSPNPDTKGIFDVLSGAKGESKEGRPYAEF
jgi:prepilin-type N-terminal cleavage/methylation domain-containing protein